jgi:spore maturation protein CgeB
LRLLIVDHYYPPFLGDFYQRHPDLTRAPFDVQRVALAEALFGETAFQVSALRSLGHEAEDVIVNAYPLRRAWAAEHSSAIAAEWHWALRRRGLIPWPHRDYGKWIWTSLIAQVRVFRPDVVYVQCVDLVPPSVVLELRAENVLVVGQLAAPLPRWPLAGYDLMISSLPNYVSRFRAAGLDAEWVPLAFDPKVLEFVGSTPRDIDVSFVGSLSPHHGDRVAILEAVARRTDVAIYSADADQVPRGSRLTSMMQGTAWGLDMYRVLARSALTINRHIDIAEQFANNLRLYEATGMGALLVTDAKANLADLFELDREVVVYRNANECAEMVEYYHLHSAERAAIAAAGQRRTLSTHTWRDRMSRIAEFIENRLRAGRTGVR